MGLRKKKRSKEKEAAKALAKVEADARAQLKAMYRRREILQVSVRKAGTSGFEKQLPEMKRQLEALNHEITQIELRLGISPSEGVPAAHEAGEGVAQASGGKGRPRSSPLMESTTGLFPSSHGVPVKVLSTAEENLSSAAGQVEAEEEVYVDAKMQGTVMAHARALYDYEAQQNDELSFWADDELDLLRMEGNWWHARITGTEEVGLVPYTYMQVLSVVQEEDEIEEAIEDADVPPFAAPAPPGSTENEFHQASQPEGQCQEKDEKSAFHGTSSMVAMETESAATSTISPHVWQMKKKSTKSLLEDLDRCENMRSQYMSKLEPLLLEMNKKFDALSEEYLSKLKGVFSSVKGCLGPSLEAEIVVQEYQHIEDTKMKLFGKQNASLRMVDEHIHSVKQFVAIRENIVKLQALVRGWLVRKRLHKEWKVPKQRMLLSKEILQTEEDYVDHLNAMIEGYMRPLHGANDARRRLGQLPLCTQQEFEAIFINLDNILSTNQSVLKELQKVMKGYNPWTSRMGQVFLKMAPYLKVYTQYVNQIDHGMQVLEDCKKKNRPFAKYLEELAEKLKASGTQQNVASLAIMPVQRIPRYALLLKSLLKYTPEDHVDHKDLEQALKAILDVADQLNESRRTSEARKQVAEIQSQLVDYKHLMQPHRYFVKKGLLETDSISMIRSLPSGPSRRTVECWFFLFNDILLVCSEHSKTSISLLDMMGSQKDQYKVVEVVPVRKIAVDEVPGIAGMPHAFEMQVSNRQPDRFMASSAAERDAWITAIRNALKECDDRRKTIKMDPKRSWKPLPPSPHVKNQIQQAKQFAHQSSHVRSQQLMSQNQPSESRHPISRVQSAMPQVGRSNQDSFSVNKTTMEQARPSSADGWGSVKKTSHLFPAAATPQSGNGFGPPSQPNVSRSNLFPAAGGSQPPAQPLMPVSPQPSGSGSSVAQILSLFAEVFSIEKSLFQLPIRLSSLIPSLSHTMPVSQLNAIQPRLLMLNQQVSKLNALHQQMSRIVRNDRLFYTLNVAINAGKNPMFGMKNFIQNVFPPGHPNSREPRDHLKALILWYTDLMRTWELVRKLEC